MLVRNIIEKREREEAVEKIGIYMCNPNGIFVNICGHKNKNLNGIFVNICGAGRSGSDNIRSLVGANFLTCNRPTTSTGRVNPVRGGAGQCGLGRSESKLPSLTLPGQT